MRNLIGYGKAGTNITWPNRAKVAINFVINYEEGAELSPVNGDPAAETYGGEFPLAPKPRGMRNLSMESLYEYGSRSGIWRLIRLFDQNKIPTTFFATGLALTLNLELCHYLESSKHEIAGHGWRWIDYAACSRKEEKEHMQLCIDTITELIGRRPQGWYTGRRSIHTRQLLKEVGGVIYDSDSYADDIPYMESEHLIVPYNLDCNDFRYTTSPGFNTGEDFFKHLKYTLDYLIHENRTTLMTIGLHPRISGRPGRTAAIEKFIDYTQTFPNVWVTRRVDIAQHWLRQQI